MLKLTLHATSYDWQFVPVAGGSYSDSGTASCHSSTPPGTHNAAPTAEAAAVAPAEAARARRPATAALT